MNPKVYIAFFWILAGIVVLFFSLAAGIAIILIGIGLFLRDEQFLIKYKNEKPFEISVSRNYVSNGFKIAGIVLLVIYYIVLKV